MLQITFIMLLIGREMLMRIWSMKLNLSEKAINL